MVVYAVAVFFCSLAAYGYPAVGDRVDLEGDTLLRDGALQSLRLSKQVVNYDRRDKRWSILVREERNGEGRSRAEKQADLYTPELYREMMAECRNRGGRAERITVPAGTFDVCHLLTAVTSDLTEEIWYGDVPFGVVKRIETNYTEGKKDTLELQIVVSKTKHQEK